MKLGSTSQRHQKPFNLEADLFWPIAFAFFLSLTMLLVAFIYLIKAQPELPILYTFDSTRGPLMKKWWLLLLPAITLLFNSINLVLMIELKNRLEHLLLSLFVKANLLITSIMFIALLRIIYITW